MGSSAKREEGVYLDADSSAKPENNFRNDRVEMRNVLSAAQRGVAAFAGEKEFAV
jgi:hypothetical protein